MPQWKKLLVSGSNIHVNEITASSLVNDNLVLVGTEGALESSGFTYTNGHLDITSATAISGSIFSGSFVGDGSGLTGLVTVLRVSGSGTDPNTNVDNIDLLTDSLTIVGGTSPITTTVTDNQIAINVQDASISQKGLAQFDSRFFSDNGSGLIALANTGSGAVLSVVGTANEVTAVRASGSGTVTVGLPDDVTITNNLYVGGDLAVNGDLTYINTQNLYVADKYILLNSGSNNPDSGGIVIDEGIPSGSGHAFIYDPTSTRWSFTGSLNSSFQGAVTPDAYAAAVVDTYAGHTDKSEYQKRGNIKVELINGVDEIFIYV